LPYTPTRTAVAAHVCMRTHKHAHDQANQHTHARARRWSEVHPSQLLGPGQVIKEYDLGSLTLDELKVWCEGASCCVGVLLAWVCITPHPCHAHTPSSDV
jgi:hypothetical protein